MKPMVLIYVADIERALPFYRALGFALELRHRRGGWAELSWGEMLLALHETRELPVAERPRVQLCFEATEPIEHLRERLRQVGLTPFQDIVDEAYGRTLQYRDPDGYVIQINEHDKALYALGSEPK
jgi:catechol 2,3-dioxygenase-like lactoylglutathione lyase family enzyme